MAREITWQGAKRAGATPALNHSAILAQHNNPKL